LCGPAEVSDLVRRAATLIVLVLALAPAAAHAAVNPQIAGLQVALRAHGLYLGPIDGVAGPKTAAAVHAFQRKAGLPVGVATVKMRLALGPLGRPLFGSRTIKLGDFGFDVAVLQFLMTRDGVYSGALDGYYGRQTAAALRRYQKRLRLTADGVVGPHTLAAIVNHDSVPVRSHTPIASAVYIVKAGDNLTEIAARYGTTVAALAAANHIDASKPIVIGTHLVVPERPAAPSLVAQKQDVQAILDSWSGRLGVDPHLVRAVAWMESGYQTRLISASGAVGVMQTLPSTRDYVETVLIGKRVPHTVDGDVEVGVTLLKHLLTAFDGNERLALAAWYQGERAVRSYGVYKVTTPFVDDVLALSQRM
jgi:peptidoglycan hydrolase-like protein with peptidoglycan-binding domain